MNSLHYALKQDKPNIKAIKSFISSVNKLTNDGISPLTIAIYNKNMTLDIIKYLLENGANVSVFENKNSYILQALLNDKIDYINLLIKHGSELTKRDVRYLCKYDFMVDKKLVDCVKDRIKKKYTVKEIKIMIKLSEINIKLVDQFITKL
jgi:hypothetical protein